MRTRTLEQPDVLLCNFEDPQGAGGVYSASSMDHLIINVSRPRTADFVLPLASLFRHSLVLIFEVAFERTQA